MSPRHATDLALLNGSQAKSIVVPVLMTAGRTPSEMRPALATSRMASLPPDPGSKQHVRFHR